MTEIPTRTYVATHVFCTLVTHIPSGYATISQDQRSLLISNLVNGIDSYTICGVSPGLSPTWVQSFRHPIRSNVPLQITSAMQGNWVISGSDDGSVRVFDQRSGELLKCLHHGDGTQCQNARVLIFLPAYCLCSQLTCTSGSGML